MKFFLIALTIFIAFSESSALENPMNIKFRFFATALSDSKTIKHGGDITSVIGTRFFDVERDTVIHLHGYNFYLQSRGAKPIIEAFIKYPRDLNIIYVDYTAYTNRQVKVDIDLINGIERAIFETLRDLRNAAGGFKKSHIVGFGLGAFISAEVGRFFINEENYSIDRITLLDPAGENFKNVFGFWLEEAEPVGNDCATFVDVVHTNGGVLGQRKPVGHVDFYVNDGTTQERCKDWWQLASFAIFDVQMFIGCNHQMSWEYWSESLIGTDHGFLAYKCPSCFDSNGDVLGNWPSMCTEKTSVSMGIYADEIANDSSKYGCYYVPTNAKSPFSKD